MTCLRLTLRTCRRPHGQLERDSGPHYGYDTFVYRRENCTLAVKKNIILFGAHARALEATVSPPNRDRIIAAFENKGGDAHWATLPYIIL